MSKIIFLCVAFHIRGFEPSLFRQVKKTHLNLNFLPCPAEVTAEGRGAVTHMDALSAQTRNTHTHTNTRNTVMCCSSAQIISPCTTTISVFAFY